MQCRVCATYETATTRHYYNGRTETVRSCTEEALKWVTMMCDSKENVSYIFEYINNHITRNKYNIIGYIISLK